MVRCRYAVITGGVARCLYRVADADYKPCIGQDDCADYADADAIDPPDAPPADGRAIMV